MEYNKYETSDGKKLKFLNDCNVINKNILLIINELDKDFMKKEKYEEIKCLIGDKKIFMRLNIDKNFAINIGHLNDHYLFISELLIHSFLFRNTSFILDNIKKAGFKYLNNFLTDKLL